MNRLLVAIALALCGSLLWSASAQATFPGTNGKFAFTVFLGDSYSELDVMNADGRDKTRLTELDSQSTSPTWSPDGTRIAFEVSRSTYDIAVMNADGTGVTKLVSDGAVNRRPAWSPDGSKIAFTRSTFEGGRQSSFNIAVVNADGTGLHTITNNGFGTDSDSPAWSPDGSRIAFASNGGIYVMNPDGTGSTKIADIPGAPNWSPDGSKIAFENQGINVMNADGTGLVRIRDSGTDPTWSPDGTKIAFGCHVFNYSICTIKPDGSDLTFLGATGVYDLDWQASPSPSKQHPRRCKSGKDAHPSGRCPAPALSEFPVPHSFGVGDITRGPDRALWFTAGGSIGRITTSGSITEFPLEVSQEPRHITAGPDGALWFTSKGAGGGFIGRIATSGSFSLFPIPTSPDNVQVEPTGIASGPDGALWFTEEQSNRIGRMTTTGAFQEFTLPSNDARAGDIVAGPDGALWFTEEVASKVGRITTSGNVTEFPTPTVDPIALTTGPDGALWFIGRIFEDVSLIGRITVSGELSEFAVPPGLSVPADITAGPDGAFWFTVPFQYAIYPHSGRIGRMTTSGVFSYFTLPEYPSPQSIAAGPDGAVWFGELAANSIGRLATGARHGKRTRAQRGSVRMSVRPVDLAKPGG